MIIMITDDDDNDIFESSPVTVTVTDGAPGPARGPTRDVRAPRPSPRSDVTENIVYE